MCPVLQELNDSMLVTYMSSLTESEGLLNDLVDKYNVSFSKSGSQQRDMRSMGVMGMGMMRGFGM